MPTDTRKRQHIHPAGEARQSLCPRIVKMQPINTQPAHVAAEQSIFAGRIYGKQRISAIGNSECIQLAEQPCTVAGQRHFALAHLLRCFVAVQRHHTAAKIDRDAWLSTNKGVPITAARSIRD